MDITGYHPETIRFINYSLMEILLGRAYSNDITEQLIVYEYWIKKLYKYYHNDPYDIHWKIMDVLAHTLTYDNVNREIEEEQISFLYEMDFNYDIVDISKKVCNKCKKSRFKMEYGIKKDGIFNSHCQLCRHKKDISQNKISNKPEIDMFGNYMPSHEKHCRHGKLSVICKKCDGSRLCEHGKVKYKCVTCHGSAICEHHKIKHLCKDCGGSSICEHNRIREFCKECGGNQICGHGRIRTTCKDCGGGSLCEHGRIRGICKECGGNQICEHGKIKYVCKDCEGSSICEHGKLRTLCRDGCGGGSYCLHDKPRYYCIICNGNGMCEHGRRKSRCTKCGGSEICEHNKMRMRCVDCEGSQICEHKKLKMRCIRCDGSQICEHLRRQENCVYCDGKQICEHGRRRYNCFTCNGNGRCHHGQYRYTCKKCGGKGICKHGTAKTHCPICSPITYMISRFHSRISYLLRNDRDNVYDEDLCCTIQEYKKYLESMFDWRMGWDNRGPYDSERFTWQIDHITPINYPDENGNKPSYEIMKERFHYTNTQPMASIDNLRKSNRFTGISRDIEENLNFYLEDPVDNYDYYEYETSPYLYM